MKSRLISGTTNKKLEDFNNIYNSFKIYIVAVGYYVALLIKVALENAHIWVTRAKGEERSDSAGASADEPPSYFACAPRLGQ